MGWEWHRTQLGLLYFHPATVLLDPSLKPCTPCLRGAPSDFPMNEKPDDPEGNGGVKQDGYRLQPPEGPEAPGKVGAVVGRSGASVPDVKSWFVLPLVTINCICSNAGLPVKTVLPMRACNCG